MDEMASDVIVIGAGVSGLAAARDTASVGLHVTLLEARGRIGGRIHTLRDERAPLPMELGAEFVHGSPREVLDLAETARLLLSNVTGRHWHLRGGLLTRSGEFWSELEEVLERMKKVEGADRSFREFLNEQDVSPEAKAVAERYVSGFHAARTDLVGVRGLNKTEEAERSIGGDDSYRILDGYDRIAEELWQEAKSLGAKLRLGRRLVEVRWQKGRVEVFADVDDRSRERFESSCVVLTLPLGVLQTEKGSEGAVRFVPELPGKEEAAKRLAVGQATRVAFLFRRRFWEELELPTAEGRESLADLGFLHADGESFPTWWTLLPLRAPVMVGWAGGPAAEALTSLDKSTIAERAASSLSRILGMERRRLEDVTEEVYLHDWGADPFARGAYSYVPVGALDAQERLAEPVEGTLFFAGEATNVEGHHGTVHGAISTGRRAARELIESLRGRA